MTVLQADLPSEFASTTASIVTFWIGIASTEVDSAKWDHCNIDSEQGITLLASHYLKEAGEGESLTTGEASVRSETVGDVATTFSVETLIASGGKTRHPTTSYGRAYDQLLARVEACMASKPAVYFARDTRRCGGCP